MFHAMAFNGLTVLTIHFVFSELYHFVESLLSEQEATPILQEILKELHNENKKNQSILIGKKTMTMILMISRQKS